jgi:hypothetical protein
MTTLNEWDAQWMGFYEYARDEGATPNEAVVIANEKTENLLGERPVEEP